MGVPHCIQQVCLSFLFFSSSPPLHNPHTTPPTIIHAYSPAVPVNQLPQCILQLYIASGMNSMDLSQALSLITSCLSLTASTVSGLFLHYAFDDSTRPRLTTSLLRSLCVNAIFIPWSLLQLTTFVPPVAFLASLQGTVIQNTLEIGQKYSNVPRDRERVNERANE